MRKKKPGLIRRILHSYRMIPQQLRSPHVRQRSKAQRLLVGTICIPLMIVCAIYIINGIVVTRRVVAQNEAYRALYAPAATPIVTQTPTAAPTNTPTPVPTAAPTAAPTDTPTPVPTAAPAVELSIGTPKPTEIRQEAVLDEMRFDVAPDVLNETAADNTASVPPTALPTPTPTASPSPSPRATADADTLVYSLPTPPPIQDSFLELLERNDETVGYLRVGDEISLPVVQRKNDNDYYLDHDFDRESSAAGTLFLDGANLLVPEDLNLIVYGHNMKNGTMFHALSQFADPEYMRRHGTVSFDTIYKNRGFVPFAVLTASMDPGSDAYVDIRRFVFEEEDFNQYVRRLKELSIYETEIDVQYGDTVLLLVTCEYSHDNGRFMVALRALRDDEDATVMNEMSKYAKLKE